MPLYDDEFCLRYGYPVTPRGPRIRLLCDAYGLQDRDGFLDVIRSRQQAQYDMLRNAALSGDDPQYARLLHDGPGPRWLSAMRYLDQEREKRARHL